VLLLLALLVCLTGWARASSTVVLWEPGFPSVDTVAGDVRGLGDAVRVRDLPGRLSDGSTRLLVMPYGSAFPEDCWPALVAYLERGGNLLCLGGRPFSVPVYWDGQWKVRAERKAWAKALYINDYVETPGSTGASYESNFDFPEILVPPFPYPRAWSLTIKLSTATLYHRIGSAGTLDARLDTLLWGDIDKRRRSAPVVEIDHVARHFVGGRWVLVPVELAAPLPSATVSRLAARALEGARDITVEPHPALFMPGEKPRIDIGIRRPGGLVRVEVLDGRVKRVRIGSGEVDLPPAAPGFHEVDVRFYQGKLIGQYRTGYWVHDAAALSSGPQVTVDDRYFRVDGRPQPIVGSTYMASDVQRQYLVHPNPFVWNRDFAQMHDAGINMVRTGLWSGWEKVMSKDGLWHEEALRNLEALLLTARRYRIPVQFNFFAFIPDVFGGKNAYLDTGMEERFVRGIAGRFAHCPWLMWDLINEPSFDKPTHLWATRANGDKLESRLWNQYLLRVHGSWAEVANAWNTTTLRAPIRVPDEQDFTAGGGGKPLMVHDFYRFAQEAFVGWAGRMRRAIRSTGSRQLVTVGQDEGGGFDRLNPSYWMDVTDFTTNHSWWQTDGLLWDSLVALQPGKPALIQETGLQNDFQIDETWRRTPAERAALLERKGTLALATTAGVIQWLWNVNADMIEDQEVTIGAVRADGTEKPEADVLRRLATFANTYRDHFQGPVAPDVAIVFDHDFLYSPFFDMATQAQRKAVLVLHDNLHVPAYGIAENRLAQMGHPRLVILPSPQVLDEGAWQKLLQYVRGGGTLLVTGSFERDAYWRPTHRLLALGVAGEARPLNFRAGRMAIDGQTVTARFSDPYYIDMVGLDGGWQEVTLGQGRLLLASYPVELSEGTETTAAVYAAALRRAAVQPPFEVRTLSSGVMVRPVVMDDAILYYFMSQSGDDEPIDIRDRSTGAAFKFVLPAGRSRLMLIDRHDGHLLGQY
jgi:hypothetical protein